MFRVVIPPEVDQCLRNLPPMIKRRLPNYLDEIAKNPRSGKALRTKFTGFRSYQVAHYRVIYKVILESKIVRIHAIAR